MKNCNKKSAPKKGGNEKSQTKGWTKAVCAAARKAGLCK